MAGVVPISVTTTLDKVTSISFFVCREPERAGREASYKFPDGHDPRCRQSHEDGEDQ